MESERDEEELRLEEHGDDLFRWVVDTYVQPEVARRVEAKELEPGTLIHKAQVLLSVGQSPLVRLNEEVRGQALATAARPIEAGETVVIDDIAGIERFRTRR